MLEKLNNIGEKEKHKNEEKIEKIKPKEEAKKVDINIINSDKNKVANNHSQKLAKFEAKDKPKEEKEKININEKSKSANINNFEKGKERKSIETAKKINNNAFNNNPFILKDKKEEKPKENEPKNKFNNIQNKTKEDNPKPNKNFIKQNSINSNQKEEQKKINPFIEKNTIKKEETAKPVASNNKIGSTFAEKMKKMNELFKNQPMSNQIGRRKTVSVPNPKLERMSWKNRGSANLGIISEEPDKMRPGYDPAANLEKTLDSVVINKRKRKMTRAVFKG